MGLLPGRDRLRHPVRLEVEGDLVADVEAAGGDVEDIGQLAHPRAEVLERQRRVTLLRKLDVGPVDG